MTRPRREPSSRALKYIIATFSLASLVALAFGPVERHIGAARLLSEMAEEDRTVVPDPGESLHGISLPDGTALRARVYGPPPEKARLSIVLLHGIHHRGIDEPRLIRFARHLADRGCRVLTPELAELAGYRVTLAGIQSIRAGVEHLASTSVSAKVGLIGFSFAGGLSLVAATDSSLAARLKYVASVGGYHDLHRSLRYLATHRVEGPSGVAERRAHEYGLLVLLYGNLHKFELGDDSVPLGLALKSWLMEDRATARRHAAALRSSKGQRLYELVLRQDLASSSQELLKLLKEQKHALLELSPAGRLAQIETEVILLHGASDSVVPPEETEFAQLELTRVKHPRHHSLISPLLEHVRVEHPGDYTQKLELVHVVSRLL